MHQFVDGIPERYFVTLWTGLDFPMCKEGSVMPPARHRKHSVSLGSLPLPHIGILAVKRGQATTLFVRQL